MMLTHSTAKRRKVWVQKDESESKRGMREPSGLDD